MIATRPVSILVRVDSLPRVTPYSTTGTWPVTILGRNGSTSGSWLAVDDHANGFEARVLRPVNR